MSAPYSGRPRGRPGSRVLYRWLLGGARVAVRFCATFAPPVAMHVFLNAPELFENLCGIARTLDVLGLQHCYVYDPHQLIQQRYKKSRARQGKAASGGAFERISFAEVADPEAFMAALPGRLIATVADEHAVPLMDFRFLPSDTLLFGSESRGIPANLRARADASVTIPQPGVARSFNLSVSVGIVLYECLRQTGAQALASPRLMSAQAKVQ